MRRELYQELGLLKKYYDVDEEERTVRIPLIFDHAEDLIDLGVERKENYPIKNEAMVDIVEKIKTIPPAFKIKLELKINDYGDYDPELLFDSVNDYLELNHYSIIREKKFFFIQAVILLAIGISILVFNGFAKASLVSENSVIPEVLDIMAWVFVWQATTVAFLTKSEFQVNSSRIKIRVKSIALLDKDSKVLKYEETFDKFKEWAGNKKLEVLSRACLLFSGGALLVSGAMSMVSAFSDLVTLDGVEFSNMIVTFVVMVIVALVEILIAVSALSSYNGRGPFSKKARFVFLPLMVLILSIETYLMFTLAADITYYFSYLIAMLASLGYIIGVILSIKLNVKIGKENKKL